jgi:hypothetical protein
MSERICAVQEVDTEMTAMGAERYVLRLTCGCTVRRLRRKRLQRTIHTAPKRVKHQCAQTPPTAHPTNQRSSGHDDRAQG